jgi:hypothetical protein
LQFAEAIWARFEPRSIRRKPRCRTHSAAALDDDWPDVLAALRAGIREGKPAERARAGIAYVQLVYGRQLQQAEDERPTDGDVLDVASMTREERDALKRRLIAENPETARQLGLVS